MNHGTVLRNENRPKTPKNRLWWHRKKMGYSQQVVAQLLGHQSTSHICAYERGKRMPSLKTALKLEIILCTPIAFLYPGLYTPFKQQVNQRRERLQNASRQG